MWAKKNKVNQLTKIDRFEGEGSEESPHKASCPLSRLGRGYPEALRSFSSNHSETKSLEGFEH